ncbi:MAG: hypothetical protein ACXVH6_03835 [Halobacteriota archaeon]
MACTLPAGYAAGVADCSSAACTVLAGVGGVAGVDVFGVVATAVLVAGAELPPPPPQPARAAITKLETKSFRS